MGTETIGNPRHIISDCPRCVHFGTMLGKGRAWCERRAFIVYRSLKGAFKYVRAQGEREKHGHIGTCPFFSDGTEEE